MSDTPARGDVAARFLSAVLAKRSVKRLLSSEQFNVGGTLIQELASMKSFRPVEELGKGSVPDWPPASGNAEADFCGERRSNATHPSTTGPDAKLYRNGPGMEAKLAFLGHAERVAALPMIEPHADRPRPITLGADRGCDAADFIKELRAMNVRPHVAQNLTRRLGSWVIDGRTTSHPSYAANQRVRKRIEEGFGRMKAVAGLDRPKLRGVDRVEWAFTFAAAAYNLVRLPKLLEAST